MSNRGRKRTTAPNCPVCRKSMLTLNTSKLNDGTISRYCECTICGKTYRVKNLIVNECRKVCINGDPVFITREESLSRGMHRYFDGEKCSHGHLSERYTLNKGCIQCNMDRGKCFRKGEKWTPKKLSPTDRSNYVVKHTDAFESEVKEKVIPGALVFLMGKKVNV